MVPVHVQVSLTDFGLHGGGCRDQAGRLLQESELPLGDGGIGTRVHAEGPLAQLLDPVSRPALVPQRQSEDAGHGGARQRSQAPPAQGNHRRAAGGRATQGA